MKWLSTIVSKLPNFLSPMVGQNEGLHYSMWRVFKGQIKIVTIGVDDRSLKAMRLSYRSNNIKATYLNRIEIEVEQLPI